jgi:hypothetical protein
MIEFLIGLVPLLALLGLLLCGRYPGHGTAMRMAERISSQPGTDRETARRPARPWGPDLRVARGGLLIAFRLAQRPPPLAS